MRRAGFFLFLAGCASSHGNGAANPPDADAGDAAAPPPVPCGDTGISKGPWVLRVNEASATMRWETCRPLTIGYVTYTPEGGTTSSRVESVEISYVTTALRQPLAAGVPSDVPGTFYDHEATFTGLTRATCYTYALGADSAAQGRFCTARAPGDALRFMAIGDTNPGLGDTKNVLAHALPMNPDFVVHGGDLQYYDSLVETWASWFPLMAPMLRQGAIFPAIGNHESETPDEYQAYTLRFFGNAGFDGTDAYYRFESGGVWFFSVDTEESTIPGSDESTWLVQSLADAAKQPGFRFSVVFFHKPFVTCGDTGDNPAARAYYAPIFKQYKVPLVLQAHMHGYERFVLDGLTYVTTAGGGGRIGNVDLNVSRDYCPYRLASGGFFHATIIDVDAATIRGTVIDDNGAVRDTFTQVIPL